MAQEASPMCAKHGNAWKEVEKERKGESTACQVCAWLITVWDVIRATCRKRPFLLYSDGHFKKIESLEGSVKYLQQLLTDSLI